MDFMQWRNKVYRQTKSVFKIDFDLFKKLEPASAEFKHDYLGGKYELLDDYVLTIRDVGSHEVWIRIIDNGEFVEYVEKSGIHFLFKRTNKKERVSFDIFTNCLQSRQDKDDIMHRTINSALLIANAILSPKPILHGERIKHNKKGKRTSNIKRPNILRLVKYEYQDVPMRGKGKGIAKRPHYRIGHWRTYTDGKKVWVRSAAIHGGGLIERIIKN